ncbi:putative receptor-like protein kinase At3g47110 [Durio zibethinus]|uniref:non-specific serine/threonine protein kinase n=1 Tax=Durio zibethinus TaxID=66656 RepID=A0A6P6AV46_DURZI|nr:putative receptor-like protein kinase At3g47110 [Durio zibethinus]
MPSPYPRHFSFMLFIVYFKCICLFMESATSTIVTDKEALLSFKSQISSSEFPNPLSQWEQNLSPCNWTGVLCNKLNTRVIALNISGFNLAGSISPHIGNLSFLRSLELQGNRLSGALPDQLGNLFRLRVLNLSSNSLDGVIPSNISKLTELRILDLMTNKITGVVPKDLDQLANLQVLNLGRNLLTGTIPLSIANLSLLDSLNLGTNDLTGTIPTDLSRLRNLKVLDLTINHLTGTVPSSIYNMSSLGYLALAANQLWGRLPYDVGDNLPNLWGFNFCFNKFTGRIPGSLHNLTNIKIIRMASNLLEGTVPPGLGNLPFLEMYNIGFNKIVSTADDGLGFITSLTNSSRLKFLAFDGNLLEGVIPESIGNLSKGLLKLYMGGNRISGNIPPSIAQLSGLTLLNLSYNSISGEIPPEIGKLEKLQMLGLAGNQISGSIPSYLGDLRQLNQIDLSGNQLVGQIPSTFQNFQQLLSMDLSNNRLNGSIPKEILNLPSLSTLLNLSRNSLNGPFPQEIGLKSVVAVDVSINRLSGSIPSSIKNCKSLEKLFMAENMLSGPIPGEIGEMKGLETLDLSSNQLSGFIPSDLQNLQLQSLNLSFNDLEGTLPSGGIFKNLSRVHLEGNPKLCLPLACKNTRGHGRLVKVYVTITVIAAFALCFIIASLFYVKKGKAKMTTFETLKRQHQLISYGEIRRATSNFNPENLIGNGSFGSVYKAYLKGVLVAIKVLDIGRTGSWKSFLAECEALRNVRHRNLVKLITSCSSMDFQNVEFLALVYEFLANGSVEDWLKGKRRNADGYGLNVMERLNVAIDVASALDYLHNDCEVPVVHCDLKPSNILLDEDMTAKVGDFGLARLLMEKSGSQPSISSTNALKGSIGYVPPEYGLGEKPSTAGDVYSFGVMLLELFTGKSPTHESFVGELNLIKWVQSAFPYNVQQFLDPELLLLVQNLQCDRQPINPEIEYDCLTTIIGVGLTCTSVSPDGRVSMRDALRKLKTVKDTLNNR